MSDPSLPDLAKRIGNTPTAASFAGTRMAGFLVPAVGILGFLAVGFAFPVGGVGPLATRAPDATLAVPAARTTLT
jgi:hypothetical protein